MMAFRCPHCGAELDATLFEFGRSVRCKCGLTVEAGHVLKLGESSPVKPEPPREKETGRQQ